MMLLVIHIWVSVTQINLLWSNRDNAAHRASVNRKNFSVFVNYDLTDSAKMYFDVYSNRFESQENGSTSTAHYTDYWFGYVNSDYTDASGNNQFSPLGAIPITSDHPYLTAESKALLEANDVDIFWINKLHQDLMPTGSGENIYNENTTDFVNIGVEGSFDFNDKTYSYDVGMSNGKTESSLLILNLLGLDGWQHSMLALILTPVKLIVNLIM